MSIRLRKVDLSEHGWTITAKETAEEAAGLAPEKPILSSPIAAVTTETVDGDGTFDVLMRTVKLHLMEEFNAGRITGNDYMQLYLGALTTILQTSTQFLVQQQQIEQIGAQIILTRQQAVTELANTADFIPEGLGINYIWADQTTINPVDVLGSGTP